MKVVSKKETNMTSCSKKFAHVVVIKIPYSQLVQTCTQ